MGALCQKPGTHARLGIFSILPKLWSQKQGLSSLERGFWDLFHESRHRMGYEESQSMEGSCCRAVRELPEKNGPSYMQEVLWFSSCLHGNRQIVNTLANKSLQLAQDPPIAIQRF